MISLLDCIFTKYNSELSMESNSELSMESLDSYLTLPSIVCPLAYLAVMKFVL